MIMLIGLVTKNGILIVEFANQQRQKGLSPIDAVREAAIARFRPVLMTSLATILGILPIALALGAGSESRRSMASPSSGDGDRDGADVVGHPCDLHVPHEQDACPEHGGGAR
jgi:Cu/Ag efflux pump CusA